MGARMNATRFRIRNYRNIDDSGWIPLEKVTAFVGRNESGKTSLLKALHKFNPATPEPYDAQREFPRDRYTRDYVSSGSRGANWPVCSVEFEIPEDLRAEIAAFLEEGAEAPGKVIATRRYDGTLECEYDPEMSEGPVTPRDALDALDQFAKRARRVPVPDPAQEEYWRERRGQIAAWATECQAELSAVTDLRGADGEELLARVASAAEQWSEPATADMVEALQESLRPIREAASEPSVRARVDELIEQALPVLIYFENYGILDGAVWLPRFIDDLDREPAEPRVRTINAMFGHVGLDPRDIAELGEGETRSARDRGAQPTPEQIKRDQERMEERSIKLNSASNDISRRFSEWWSQRRHKIRYHADGDYLRIWVADDRRPDVEIELEARSKGFQWFFSFYLVFLAESQGGHKDAMLLLDEPGLHLHPTAQQELIRFFERLAKDHLLAYTTHSPFLIDGEHLHRVRPVTEDERGHSCISSGTWPSDQETIFPLQAAAGYAMIRGLFQHHSNLLVEGMTDFYYLHALSQLCAKSGRASLPEDVHVTPCGGTKNVGRLASLFLGHRVRPVVLLDGDDAGRVRHDALMKALYVDSGSDIVMLDEVLKRPGDDVEIEDVLGEALVVSAVGEVLESAFQLDEVDRSAGSLPSQIKAAARRQGIQLPDGWKALVAQSLVTSWAEGRSEPPKEVLDDAAALLAALNERLGKFDSRQ
ncbi:AAA family ATPase [Candidatus Palauibacter sp.]|uniref:AAA family ATPase n=1 Tax=Candidatus Palauibacter sp. TaxID=3101350 RepID=UPI003B5C0D50